MDSLFPAAAAMPELDLSFLSTDYDAPPTSPEPLRKAPKVGDDGKPKKTRNRKHHACEPCRQHKVKCDRQSNCANCRLHHKRCYYVDAMPIAASAEDELVAAREEIERLRALVRLLTQGGSAASTSAAAPRSLPHTSFFGAFALPSPPSTAASTSSSLSSSLDYPHHPHPQHIGLPSPPRTATYAPRPAPSFAPSLTAELAGRPPPPPSTAAAAGRFPVLSAAPSFASAPPSAAPAPVPSSTAAAAAAGHAQLLPAGQVPPYLDPTLFLAGGGLA
ncbi:hypothetical protein JCM10207_002441 [Rhodosporidiobolus poonsookiae]